MSLKIKLRTTRAWHIVEDFNLLDIDAHETMWRASGCTGGELQRGDADAPVVAPVNVPISEQSTVQRSGMRIYPRDTGAPNQDSLNILRGDRTDDDAVYFRSHWEKSMAYAGNTYQVFDPAYRYGESMAGNPGYKDKPWEHVEPELRSDWQSKHAQSSWEKFKEAVRAGWERASKWSLSWAIMAECSTPWRDPLARLAHVLQFGRYPTSV